jgi:hypothetical protein
MIINLSSKALFVTVSLLILPVVTHSAVRDSVGTEAKEKLTKDLQEFFRDLEKENPSLSDYQKWFGSRDYEEIGLYWNTCEEKGNTPFLRNDTCVKNLIKKWSVKDKSSSIYLSTLKNFFPQNPIVVVKSVKMIQKKVGVSEIKGYRIKALINNNVIVEIWKNHLDIKSMKIVMIDGIPIEQLIGGGKNLSILAALGKTELLRPLSEKEKRIQKDKYDRYCNADPACIESRKKRSSRAAIQRNQENAYQKVETTYSQWCKENNKACVTYKTKLEQLNVSSKEIQKLCESSPNGCEEKVKKWHLATKNIKSEFCAKNVSLCLELYTAEQKNNATQYQWCKDTKAFCSKSITAYNRALIKVKSLY